MADSTTSMRQVPSEQEDQNAEYRSQTCSLALAVLLEKSGYPEHAQRQHILFYEAIAPCLGPALDPGVKLRWQSFMTDNHTPIELSWDWRVSGNSPKIRYAIEPVGAYAGTPLDPFNSGACDELRKQLQQLVPAADTTWLSHFRETFRFQQADSDLVQSCENPAGEFYAFDLGDDGAVMIKAYLFPELNARATQRSNFEVIVHTIQTAPEIMPERLRALETFQDYVRTTQSQQVEMDMLAIDIEAPSESRLKIYFRNRDTSFASVIDTMSLGNRIQSAELDRGLPQLRQLYHTLMGGREAEGSSLEESDQWQLAVKDHRTAGMIYNVELKPGSSRPRVKIYFPVRHYATSDDAIMRALEKYFISTDDTSARRQNFLDYKSAINLM